MLNVTIDGYKVEVPEGTTVLNAAKMAGIAIPALCHHAELTPFGGCRLCVVEVEGAREVQTSCTLPVSDGMVVLTDTPKLRKARKWVLSLFFSERNHFCMVCQKSGGDCELQNAAYNENMVEWPLQPNWQPLAVDFSQEYFLLDRNRCILCRRCIRACSELVGNATLNVMERGAKNRIIADLDVPLGESSCISCGMCVQVCSTGALIDRQSAYRGLEEDVERIKSICVQCDVGCGVELVVRDNHLLRIEGDWDAPVNAGLLCEKGRYHPLKEERERIKTPLVRKDGSLQTATWDEALEIVADRLKRRSGSNGVAAFASPRLSIEALHLFQQLFADRLGSKMVTATDVDVTAMRTASLPNEANGNGEGRLDALNNADCVVVVGADLIHDHQVVGFMVKRALPQGTKLVVIDASANPLQPLAHYALKPLAGTEADLLRAVVAGAMDGDLASFTAQDASQTTGVPVATIRAVTKLIGASQRPFFIYAADADHDGVQPVPEILAQLSRRADLPGGGRSASLRIEGLSNSTAARRLGLNTPCDLNGEQVVFLALGDDLPGQNLIQRLEGAPFVVVQASYASPATARADVVLPVATWVEQEGHYLNLEGRIQATRRGLTPPEGVMSNAALLAALAQRTGVDLDADWSASFMHRAEP